MTRDESIPIRDVSAGEIKQAREGAAVLDLAEVAARHAADHNAAITSARSVQAHADRGALLAALREEREQLTVRLCRLIGAARDGVVRAWLDEDGRVCVLPRAYEKHITVDIGFAAPALPRHVQRPGKRWDLCSIALHSDDCDCRDAGGDR